MSLAQSIYTQTRKFLYDSAKEAQYARGAAILGAGGAAYGAVRGVTSDNTTVMGGSVGGGTFGAALGVGAAYALHKNAGARSFLKDIHASAFGVNARAKNLAERMENTGVPLGGISPHNRYNNAEAYMDSFEGFAGKNANESQGILGGLGSVVHEKEDVTRAFNRNKGFFDESDARFTDDVRAKRDAFFSKEIE